MAHLWAGQAGPPGGKGQRPVDQIWPRTVSGLSRRRRASATDTGVCIGTVVEWVQYNVTAAKTWQVVVYSAAYPGGQVVANRTFTLGRGWYFWSFGVHQAYSGLSAVCLTADDSFGVSCLHFDPA